MTETKSLAKELVTFPGWRIWLGSLASTAVLLVLAWWIMPDFADLDARPGASELVIIALTALFFPAIVEEVVFRGLLNRSQSIRAQLLSTLVFVIWHPVGALFILPEARSVFFDPRFLIFTACFGLLFCQMRLISGSLLPPIVCHWLVVVTWKALGGAQFMTG